MGELFVGVFEVNEALINFDAWQNTFIGKERNAVSTIIGVLAQRLIRRCCVKCREPYTPSDDELSMLGVTREQIGDRPFYKGRGCEECNKSGYKKRVGIFELLLVSPKIQQLINEKQPTQIIKEQAMAEGMVTMRQDGIAHILDGVTTSREVLQYTI